MITCPSCGKELEDGSKFCDACGTPIPEAPVATAPADAVIFCPSCGAQNSEEYAFCQLCGAPLHEEPSAKTEKADAGKKPVNIKPILFGVAGIAAVLLIVFIATRFIGGGGGSPYALYLKDGELYYNNFSKNGPVEVTSRLDSGRNSGNSSMYYLASELGPRVALSSDGKTLFYPDRYDGGEFSLYYRNIKKPAEEPTRIDTGITNYFVTEKGDKIFYVKGGTLYQNDLKDNKEKIASDVASYSVSLDGSKIAYQDEDRSLYVWAGGDKEKIASDIEFVYRYSDNLSTIHYIKEGAVYKYADGDSEKIIPEYNTLVSIYESGEIYYITSEEQEIRLADYVNDNMASADAAMTEPVRPIAPDYPYYNYWNYDADAYEAALAQYEIDYAAYQADNEKYQQDYQAYREKESRDNLRSSLESQTLTRMVYSLYYFDGSDSILVSDAVADAYSYSSALEKPVMVVRLNEDQEEVGKVRLSDISSVYEVSSRVDEALMTASEYYIVTGSSVSSFDQEAPYYFCFANDGSKILFLDEMDSDLEYGDLYLITVSKDQPGSPSLYDTDVSVQTVNITKDGSVYYFKDVNSRNEGELFIDQKSVEFDVSCYSHYYDSDLKALFYYTDYSWDRGDGTLMMYKNYTSTKINDDIHDFTVISGNDILYLYDFSSRSYSGALYLYDGKNSEKIDDDVSGIVRIYNTERRRDYFGW